jgi:crossover junction endodeoxyribonuclease RuvC
MLVLGVDPGLNITGYALVALNGLSPVLVEAGELRSKASHTLEQRLSELYRGFDELLCEFTPDVVSVEELYAHYQHPRTAVIMGHARGVFFLAAGMHGIPVFSYGATRIKKSLTGSGHASKEQVAGMVARILNSADIQGHADVSDAIATALCHLNVIAHGSVV